MSRSVKSAPKAPRTTIREVTDPADPAVSDAYALLTKMFHRGERVARQDWTSTMREQAQGLHTDVFWHLLVAEHENEVIGFASGTFIGNVNLGVIGYLAISPLARASGLGSRLRATLKRRFMRDARRHNNRELDGLVGEVSHGNPWLRVLNRKPGVLLLDLAYYQPKLREDDEPSPFVLYYEAVGRPVKSFKVAELRRILYAMWRRAYRIGRPLDRPAFRRMLTSLSRRRTIGRLKLPSLSSHA
jgi:hypothetical protein